MNTKNLTLFVQVAKTGNITQVANRLHISQPAVSMQIKRLEEEIGVPLLALIGRNISVTDAGKTFLEYAESILSLEGQLHRAMDEFREGKQGKIVIGASAAVGTYLIPPVIRSFTQTYPDIQIELVTQREDEVERLVREGNVDIGFTFKDPEEHLSLRVTRYTDDRWIGIQPLYPPESRHVFIAADTVIPEDERLGEITRLDSMEAVKHFVAEGIGYGVVLESAAFWELEFRKLLEWTEYKPWSVTVNIITRPAERLAKSIWLFLYHVRKQ